MTVTIHTPVEGFSGEVAGVVFEDGVSVTDLKDLSYFERHGYIIDPAEPEPESESEPEPEPESESEPEPEPEPEPVEQGKKSNRGKKKNEEG